MDESRMMKIRRATPNDVDTIYELGKTVDEFMVNPEDTVTFWPKETLRRAMHTDDVLVLLAEDEGILGFVIVNYNQGLRKATIENIYVRPDRRSQGVSDRLLHEMIELLNERECEYVMTLISPDSSGGIGLYTRNGFGKGNQFIWMDRSLGTEFERSE
jgi:ribosomal protein S18 acetylase RimI-like enzyme